MRAATSAEARVAREQRKVRPSASFSPIARTSRMWRSRAAAADLYGRSSPYGAVCDLHRVGCCCVCGGG